MNDELLLKIKKEGLRSVPCEALEGLRLRTYLATEKDCFLAYTMLSSVLVHHGVSSWEASKVLDSLQNKLSAVTDLKYSPDLESSLWGTGIDFLLLPIGWLE